jgi:hypothetical protein
MDTDDSNPQKKSTGFSLRKEDIKVIDALKDFERYRDKKAWELAFRAISGVAEGESKGMVPSKDGFFVPMRRQIWRSLASLPPEGREAYRLFYDAKGKQAFDALVNKSVEEATDLASLRKVVEQYFVTSIGDQAADRLGDMYFEAGDFLAAEGAWASIVSDYPDSDIPKLRLQVKRATALARAGRIEQFEEIAKSIRSDYSGQTVMLGGKEVQTSEYLDGLASAAASTRPAFATTQQTQEQLALPKEEKPLWQMHFVSTDLADKVAAAVNNMGWGDFSGIGKFVPATVSDGRRVYVNWIGIIFALEQSSGKLVWRTDKFTDIDSKVQELVQYSVDARRYDLSIVGDKLLAVTAPLRQIQNGLDAYRLMCINPRHRQKRVDQRDRFAFELRFPRQAAGDGRSDLHRHPHARRAGNVPHRRQLHDGQDGMERFARHARDGDQQLSRAAGISCAGALASHGDDLRADQQRRDDLREHSRQAR